MISSRPHALPDWSAVPGNSDEDRRLVNERLAYFGAVASIVSGTFYAVVLAISMLLGMSLRTAAQRPENVLHLAATLVFALEWLLCRGARCSSRQLNIIDVGTTFGSLATFAIAFVVIPQHGFEPALVLTLITVAGLLTRAVVVPGTARRTLWVSVLCCLPTLVASYVIARQAPQTLAAMKWSALASCVYVGTWLAMTVALATLASRIIYGLSQRVRAATELGQYTLEEKIGEGGMGTVYRARHALLRRPTAVKLLPPEVGGEKAVRRFEREVQLTSALTHPNTIAIYDYGRSPEGIFYYAMEYLEGITLEDLVIHDGPQPPGRVVHLLKQICGALAEAHDVHLIHRDIKPANIVLCIRGGLADYVKVLDFGLVKEVAAASPKLSTAQAVMGTPAYLAPEALTRPDEIDARADLYAVGAVAYELLAGKPAFDGASVVEVCARILHETPAPPSERGGGSVPPALEELVLACLSKDPGARPQSALEISEALDLAGDRYRWTAQDAKRWWDQRAPAILAAVKAGAARRDPSSERRTMGVDLVGRRWAVAE
jgi:serine/threonine-protein kinase